MSRRSIKPMNWYQRFKANKVLLMLFLAFVAYKIITPPTKVVAQQTAPDGSGTAQLRKIYYVAQPSYKVYFREKGALLWQNLLYLNQYTNVPHASAQETLEWSPDSRYLFFKINEQPIWGHDFNPPTSNGATP